MEHSSLIEIDYHNFDNKMLGKIYTLALKNKYTTSDYSE